MDIDLGRQQVRFRLRKGAAFDEEQLGKAFASTGWKPKVLSRPSEPQARP